MAFRGKYSISTIQKKSFTLKFCQTCKVFRPLRGHHCKLCGLCVEGFDHHSQLTSNCIGKRNRRSFFFMLCFAMGTALEIFVLSLYNLLNEKSQNDKTRVIYSLIFLILSSFLFFSIGMILLLQIYLISNGFNTVEYFRGRLKKDQNPFDEGFFSNWIGFLKGSRSHGNVDINYLKENASIEITENFFKKT